MLSTLEENLEWIQTCHVREFSDPKRGSTLILRVKLFDRFHVLLEDVKSLF